jgi:RHS repeat-associated protein
MNNSSLRTLVLAAFACAITLQSAWAQIPPPRKSAFTYFADSGLLKMEFIEPDDQANCLVTEYTYDNYGNRASATTRNCNGEALGDGTNAATAPPAAANPLPASSVPTALSVASFAQRQSTSDFSATSVTIGGVAYAHTAGQFPTQVRNALTHLEKKAYNARFGVLKAMEGPNGGITKWAYDGFGRKIAEARHDGTGTKWEYKRCADVGGCNAVPGINGNVSPVYFVEMTPYASASIDTAGAATFATVNGPVSRAYHDSLNRVIRQETEGFDGTSPAIPACGATTTKIYADIQFDELGRVKKKSRPYCANGTAQWQTFTYDILGRVTRTDHSDGTYNTVSYEGLIIRETNEKGQVRVTEKNSQGQVWKITDHLGNLIENIYDVYGNLKEVKKAAHANAGGTATGVPAITSTTMEYDTRGRKTKMTDPDMGMWEYRYNALGELRWQQDPEGRAAATKYATEMQYDVLGRMVKRLEKEMISNWLYDTVDGLQTGTHCGAGTFTSKGKLCKVTTENNYGYERTHGYDDQGRPASTTTKIGIGASQKVFTAANDYYLPSAGVHNGRLKTQGYPLGGLTVRYVYTARGYLASVINQATPTITYWQADAMDAEGRVTQSKTGNNVVSVPSFNAQNGRLDAISVGASGSIVSLTYNYDAIGNVTRRQDSVRQVNEGFCYDGLNRLTRVASLTMGTTGDYCAIGTATALYTYDGHGNIKTSLAGTYAYAPTGAANPGGQLLPHAVASVGGSNFTYDRNGNMRNDAGREVQWTSFNLPSKMCVGTCPGTQTIDLQYGAEHQRIKQTITGGTSAGTIYYANDGGLLFEREELSSGRNRNRHYLSAGGSIFGMLVIDSQTGTSQQYWHKDHLGSVVAVTKGDGSLCERFSYAAFGNRTNVTSGLGAPASPCDDVHPTDRGYTTHEHLEELNLIHMNGRVYDPVIARFMSADPSIDGMTSMQGYNRYSYVSNNPLSFTDPSGFGRFKAFGISISWKSDDVKLVATVAAAVFVPQLATNFFVSSATSGFVAGGGLSTAFVTLGGEAATLTAFGSITAAAAGGFAAGTILGGNLESGLKGAAAFALGAGIAPYLPSGMMGEMIGGGINGYLQTGTSRGFARGFLGGAIPEDLGMDAYREKWYANIGIGIARDGLRGGIVGGRDGILRGIRIGQFTNAFGHLYGAVSSNFASSPDFRNGAFYYPDTRGFGKLLRYEAITFGNVITGLEQLYTGALSTNWEKWLDRHERGHIGQARWMGGLYLPLQGLSQWTGWHVFEYGPHHPLGYETQPPRD